MHDPESRGRNRLPSAADVNASPKKPAQPLVGPVKPPSYTEPGPEYDNKISEGEDVSILWTYLRGNKVLTTLRSFRELFRFIIELFSN